MTDTDKIARPARKHDDGKPALHLLPPRALVDVARVMSFGARKYESWNYLNGHGLEWSRLERAALGHILAWAMGEDVDPESGLPHLAHAACSVLMLSESIAVGKGTDDRWRPMTEPTVRLEHLDGEERFLPCGHETIFRRTDSAAPSCLKCSEMPTPRASRVEQNHAEEEARAEFKARQEIESTKTYVIFIDHLAGKHKDGPVAGCEHSGCLTVSPELAEKLVALTRTPKRSG